MKAAIVQTLGKPPVLGQFAEPIPIAGETVVNVIAAGIKQLDRAIVRGTHYSSPKILPIVPGTDGIGSLSDGSRVYFASFRPPFGAMAEKAVASWYVPVPPEVNDATAAALINPGLAAWLPLVWRAKIQPGETVLIMGATAPPANWLSLPRVILVRVELLRRAGVRRFWQHWGPMPRWI
ncbi:putative NAD(P)H quinone oxidoreductase%2C PIG3 family [Yersinia kristensenii]|nr:putative NAD(P)H quinone oxidoreductase%2C PIG3 family [Yersinia kristensenii]